MKRSWGAWLSGSVVIAIIALAFVSPQKMVSPGPLIAAHADLSSDCFACHSPGRGASADKCMGCHKPTEIGVRTTRGALIIPVKYKISFHQELIESDCMRCHRDHKGSILPEGERKPFAHTLLTVQVRNQCASCHSPPVDDIHRQVNDRCDQCHRQNSWTPATFDHNKYFALDRNHDAKCSTCHASRKFSEYTCYGCHEHSREKVQAAHLEEDIQQFDDCVKCHRSAQGESESGRSEGQRERD